MPSRLPIRLGNSGALMWRHPKAPASPILFLASGNGTLSGQSRSGTLTLTAIGAQRYAANGWPGEQAFYIEEGTTNQQPDPVMEYVDTTYWSANQATRGKTASPVLSGTQAMGITKTGALAGIFTLSTARPVASAGQSWSAQAWLYHTLGGASRTWEVRIDWFTAAGGSISSTRGTAVAVPNATWTQLTVTGVAPGTTGKCGMAIFDTTGTTNGESWFIDNCQLEQKDHVTSVAPVVDASGVITSGYAWSGTAHASANTRTAATLTIPNTAAPVSLAYRYSEDFGTTWQFGYRSGVGALGTNGLIAVSGSDLVISTTRSLQIGPIAGYDRALTSAEQTLLGNTDPANWWGAL